MEKQEWRPLPQKDTLFFFFFFYVSHFDVAEKLMLGY